LFGNPVVVGTESRSDMYDAGSVFCTHIIPEDYPERISFGTHPGHQLFITDTFEFRTFEFSDFPIGNQFVSCLIIFQGQTFGFGIEIGTEPVFGQNDGHRKIGIRIISLYDIISDIGSYSQGGIGRQSPGCSCPRQDIYRFAVGKQLFGFFVPDYLELGDTSRILYIPVTSRLVQFVCTQTGTCSRRIRLYGITFIKKSFFIQFLQ